MSRKLAIITIHGMGDTSQNYYKSFKKRLVKKLGAQWNNVSFHAVYYQHLLQENQIDYFDRVKTRLDWLKMRRFVLYGFSDAGGLEYSRTIPGSIYTQVQQTIFDTMRAAWNNVGPDGDIVFIAQSLGGQVLSNYIWDADQSANGQVKHGLWSEDHTGIPTDELNFLKLKSLKVLITTGCNIPIFVAGLKRELIKPIRRADTGLVWENYFDEDDILGWPLCDLSDEYDELVTDVEIKAGGFLTSWSPISHVRYWTDKDVINPIVSHARRLLNDQ